MADGKNDRWFSHETAMLNLAPPGATPHLHPARNMRAAFPKIRPG